MCCWQRGAKKRVSLLAPNKFPKNKTMQQPHEVMRRMRAFTEQMAGEVDAALRGWVGESRAHAATVGELRAEVERFGN